LFDDQKYNFGDFLPLFLFLINPTLNFDIFMSSRYALKFSNLKWAVTFALDAAYKP